MPADFFAFGPFQLDAASRRLTRNGEDVVLPPRPFDLLHILVARAGQVLSKDALVEAAWDGVAVTDNSVEQAISVLRRTLGDEGHGFIETQARRGYRFTAPVRRVERREAEDALEALLAPHRAWVEGRAALETLERAQIVRARDVFAHVVAQVPDQASAHVGLASACVMQFEMTRAEAEPDIAALGLALTHAREACRLDPRHGEAWATLGFALDRAGQPADAQAALRMAVSLEPDNWRHQVRLAYVTWGEERLRAARRALGLLPGLPMAHWLAATVLVARQALDDAELELRRGLDALALPEASGRFSSVGLHWLLGLLRWAKDDHDGAVLALERELAGEGSGQLYARECCANAWYALAAIRLADGDASGASAAIDDTLRRIPAHPSARALRVLLDGGDGAVAAAAVLARQTVPSDASGAAAVLHVRAGDVAAAVRTLDTALATAPPGSALWTLPVEPVLRVLRDGRWGPVLARLRLRAA